jgi:STE24 endopeptidase
MVDTGFESNEQPSKILEIDKKISRPQLVTDYDPERRKLALLYTRSLRKFDFRLAIASFIIMIFIVLSKVSVIMEDYIEKSISKNPFVVVGIFYILVFLFLSIIELPIAYYSLSRFSRKYGLTKLSNKQWFKRRIKGESFGLILGLVVFEGFFWFLRTFPNSWWIWGTVALIIFSVILANLIPIFILPRFYKFMEIR